MNQTKPTYKQQGNVGLFDSDETMENLNAMGNPLDKLSKADISSQRPADGIPDPRQALVPRLPRTGQRRQSARRENNMGFQGGIDKERSFWAIVQ